VILLSLASVVASAATLVWGIATASQGLVWASLAAGLAATALVVASVLRRRASLVLDAAGAVPPLTRSAAPQAPAPSVPASSVPPQPHPVPGSWPPVWASPADPAYRPEVAAEAAERPLGEPFPPPASAPPADDGIEADVPAGRSVDDGEPPVEDVPVGDALRAAQLDDEVLVVDGHPRYHLPGCRTLVPPPGTTGSAGTAGAGTTALPLSAARRSGFTPCGVCGPDRTLLARSRERRTGRHAAGTEPTGT